MEAYERFASKQMSIFHCEKMLATVLGKYIVNSCRGEGRRLRQEHLVNIALESGRFPDTPEMRSILGKMADEQIGPTQDQFNRYSSAFLIGKPVGFSLDDVIKLVSPKEAS